MDKPKIRFKGYTEEWEQRKLGDVAIEFKSGISLKADEIEPNGVYPVYGGNGLRGYTSTYNHDGEFALIGRQGALCGNMNYSVGKAYFTEHAVVVQANENNDTQFLYYLLDTMKLGQYSDQSAQPGLAVNKLIRLENVLPNKAEQIKIGEYFRHLDRLITLHQQKCEEVKKLKKYMLQNMFPRNGRNVPEIRFDGFTDAWEQRKLGDYSELITKGTTPSSFCEDGNVTFVKIEALREKRVIKELCSSISEEIHKGELARSILRENDIVFAIAGATVGKCAIITSNILPANTNQALAIIRLKSSINRDFVYFSLTSKQMEIYINQSKGVGAQPNLSLAQMNVFEFLCPCKKEEQQKIGDYFSTLDNLITLHQRKCDGLKKIKKFMLQNMFV